jgi:hypothetical protein
MKKIYDNGYGLLGEKQYLVRYLKGSMKLSDMEDLILDMLKELEQYNDTDVLYINYDFGMGYHIESWEERDIMKDYAKECE